MLQEKPFILYTTIMAMFVPKKWYVLYYQIDSDNEWKVSHPILLPRVLFRTTPTWTKVFNPLIVWRLCSNSLHSLRDKIDCALWNVKLIKEHSTLPSLVNFSRRIKGRSPDVKLLLWGNAFTHVMSRKWPSGIQRTSELKSNCFFCKHWAINL